MSLALSIPSLIGIAVGSQAFNITFLSIVVLAINAYGIHKRNMIGFYSGLFLGVASVFLGAGMLAKIKSLSHVLMAEVLKYQEIGFDEDVLMAFEELIQSMTQVTGVLVIVVGFFYLYVFYKNRDAFN
ncbi:MAG: hypothetical protein AB7O96_16910 [Pseudobdellovibrionaceae bacterium]